MHNIDSALIYALIALFQMASSNKDSWVQDLRKLICINQGRGWSVNGEGSGRIKVIYVINEGKGAASTQGRMENGKYKAGYRKNYACFF